MTCDSGREDLDILGVELGELAVVMNHLIRFSEAGVIFFFKHRGFL
jgi:hypothetical protein